MEDRPPLEEYPAALFNAVAGAYAAWLTRCIVERGSDSIDRQQIEEVVRGSARAALDDLSAFLATDVDEQKTNPLHILRQSTRLANELLATTGAVPPHRDEFEISAMPHDVFSIGPLTWRDLSEDVHDAGITWGAWKAATVLSRRRTEGKIV